MKIDPKCSNMVDLFCGAGGLSLGFEWAGFNCLVANDNFKDASETYQSNFVHNDFVFGDITELSTKHKIIKILKDKEAVDIVVGGPPCQGFSNAGKRLIDDPRNKLYKEFINIVVSTKPRVVLMENVEGILSMDEGKVFSEIRSDLEELGYFVEARKLNTVEYGIPQRRKRVIIIGSRDDNADLMFPSKITDITEPLTTRDAIGDLPLDPVIKIETNVKPNKPSSLYQKLMQGKISPENFIRDLGRSN
jgi:DNA (cytosine-5)-methyltransferase 1